MFAGLRLHFLELRTLLMTETGNNEDYALAEANALDQGSDDNKVPLPRSQSQVLH